MIDQKIKHQIDDIIRQATKYEYEFNENSRLKEDLGLDSLDIVELVMFLEENPINGKYISIEDSEMEQLKTIDDIYKLFNKKLN
jgi:acyl carrier protein